MVLVSVYSSQDWQSATSKGVLLLDDQGDVVSHQYKLRVPEDSQVWITIEPTTASRRAPVDTMLCLTRDDGSVVTFTEERNSEGVRIFLSFFIIALIYCQLTISFVMFVEVRSTLRSRRRSLQIDSIHDRMSLKTSARWRQRSQSDAEEQQGRWRHVTSS